MSKELITREQYALLLKNGAAINSDPTLAININFSSLIKLVSPDHEHAWLIKGVNPVDGDTLYGVHIKSKKKIFSTTTSIEKLVRDNYSQAVDFIHKA